MEFDLVDTMTKAIKRLKDGFIFVGEESLRHHLVADNLAKGDEFFISPRATFVLHGLAQRRIGGVRIVRRQERRLIYDFVCGKTIL